MRRKPAVFHQDLSNALAVVWMTCKASNLRAYEQRIFASASPPFVHLPDLTPEDMAQLVEIECERINAAKKPSVSG
jgi:hypothetical protein